MKTITVYSFKLGDCEDPEIYAAQPLYEWERSEHGQWVMQHAIEPPLFHIRHNHNYMGYQIDITAKLWEEDTTYHLLKWGFGGV